MRSSVFPKKPQEERGRRAGRCPSAPRMILLQRGGGEEEERRGMCAEYRGGVCQQRLLPQGPKAPQVKHEELNKSSLKTSRFGLLKSDLLTNRRLRLSRGTSFSMI